MRSPSITSAQALAERMVAKEQVDATVPESAMPDYMEMFLAHLRLLVGVPFDYLVPDSRLLPDESIRFFYLDRSWTDRLVDGAISVGKTGSREQAHHEAHSDDVQHKLDFTQRTVRILQRGLTPDPSTDPTPGDFITGFLLRSAAVRGWPSMDVRAFNTIIPPSPGTDDANWALNATKAQIKTLRLELLSPSVLLALFDGVPQCVWCEEPHHGVQFGFTPTGGTLMVEKRTASGAPDATPPDGKTSIPLPVRAANGRVVAVQALRTRLFQLQKTAQNPTGDPNLIPQTGSAAFAIELLNYPWRQRFENATSPNRPNSTGAFVPTFNVANVIAAVQTAVQDLFK